MKTAVDPSKKPIMTEHEDSVSIDLPQYIVSRVEDRLPRTEFDTTEEYVTFAMEEVLRWVEEETRNDDYEPIDENEVKDRLKSLGYLDE